MFFNGKVMTAFGQITNVAAEEEAYNEGFTAGRQEGYEAGQQAGYTAGQSEGVAQGKQAEYDRFWDACQQNGNRNDYSTAFYGKSWTNDTFKPKYNIVPLNGKANGMFQASAITGSLEDILRESGIALDLSVATNISAMFSASAFSKITLDLSETVVLSSYSGSVFASCANLQELSLNIGSGVAANNWFANTTGITTISITGTIAQNGFNFSTLPNLSLKSLRNIIAVLKDYSAYTGSTVWKITFGSTNLAKLGSAEIQEIQSKGWTYA